MLVEINNLKEGIITCKKNSKGEYSIEIVSYDQLTSELNSRMTKLEEKELSNKININNLVTAKIPEKIDAFTKKHDRLVNFMAYEVMLDDINYNGIDYPENFEEIKKWILEQKGEVPAGFDKYIKQVKGEVSEND